MVPKLRPLRVPPPLLVMATLWLAGLVPPCVAAKVRLLADKAMPGGSVDGATVKVTDTICGLLLAEVAARKTFALYVPATIPPVIGCNVRLAGAVVELRVGTCNQPVPPDKNWMSGEFKPLSVPPPPLVMLTTWLGGLAPPWVAEKLRLAGVSTIAGPAEVTVNVTLSTCGLSGQARSAPRTGH